MTKYIGNILADGAPASYSCVFDGSGDYIDTPSNAALGIGSGDFTIEFFVNFNSVAGFQSLFDFRSAQPSAAPIIYLNNDSRLNYLFNSGTPVPFGPNPLIANTWYHVAWVRSSGVNTMYVNGQSQTSFTDSSGTSSSIVRIGARQAAGASDYVNGYISNFRFVKGTAVYTANFTPPTQLFAVSGTSLLTCQQPTIIDVSSNAFAITVNGDTKVSTFTPFPAYQAYNPASGGGTPGMWSLNDAAYAAQTGRWNMYDPYWKNVTLLLNGENAANAAQNNTFLDSSTNNFTITRNGNTTQGSFSPYGNLWSNYFNGSTGYLSTSYNSAFDLASTNVDFTIEAFVYAQSYATIKTIAAVWPQSTGDQWMLALGSSGQLRLEWAPFSTNSEYLTGGTVPLNTWTHVAVTKSSSVFRLFVNGNQVATGTNSATSGTSSPLTIGYYGAGIGGSTTSYWNGYISNLRIVKGTAVYTSNFTPSTTPLTAVSGTSLLTCQSNRFIDNSSNNFALTVNGNTSVQRFSPFNPTAPYSASTLGGSAYFDGTGDLLSIASSSQFSIGSSTDFTFETWVYYIGTAANYSFICYFTDGTNALGFRTGSPGFGYRIQTEFGPSVVESLYDNDSYTVNYLIGRWTHLGFSRINGVATFYINGVNVSSKSSNTISLGTSNFQISNTSYSYQIPGGYVAGTRLIVGTGINFSAVGVPTAPPTPITNTKLLCNFTNAGIPDAAMMNDLETVGNAQVSTSVKKYGTGAMYFNGTDGNLVAPYNPVYAFGTGDFTVEGWFYFTDTGTTQRGLVALGDGANGSGPVYNSWSLVYRGTEGSNQIVFYRYDGTEYSYLTSGATISAGTWTHIAVSRGSGTLKIFVNGVAYYSASNSLNFSAVNTNPLRVALQYYGPQSGYGGPRYWPGYIDDLRITKGYARYTANFTPPTSSLQNL